MNRCGARQRYLTSFSNICRGYCRSSLRCLICLSSVFRRTRKFPRCRLRPTMRIAWTSGWLQQLSRLAGDIVAIAAHAECHAKAMDYSFLFERSRQLLSIGYDGVTGELNGACYDLLASEARIASFLAVAKGDIPQQAWFRLDRSHVFVEGRASLLSWTGTMFEYMMPALWMRTYPNTLIARSLESVARIQRNYEREIPWGISESGCARIDEHGRYGYQAWGIPSLALKYGAEDGPVISPYSTFLALPFLRDEALVPWESNRPRSRASAAREAIEQGHA